MGVVERPEIYNRDVFNQSKYPNVSIGIGANTFVVAARIAKKWIERVILFMRFRVALSTVVDERRRDLP